MLSGLESGAKACSWGQKPLAPSLPSPASLTGGSQCLGSAEVESHQHSRLIDTFAALKQQGTLFLNQGYQHPLLH